MNKSAAALLVSVLLGCAPQSADKAEVNPNAAPPTNANEKQLDNSMSQPHIGSWKATSAVMAGKPFPDEVVNSISLTLTEKDYVAYVGPQADKGTCEVDRTAQPNRMKITGTDGPNVGKTMLAIVDFPEADKMRVAYDLAGKEYPSSFESTAETGYYVAEYKKAP